MEDSFRYDVRVRDRLLKKGLLKAEEVEKHLAALPDVESQAEPVSIEQPGVDSHAEGGR